MESRTVLLSLLLASACTPDGVIQAGATSNEGAAAHIEVSPPSVHFGALAVGERATDVVQISNVGDASLDLYAIQVAESSAFTIEGDLEGVSLAPGEAVELTLSYGPLGVTDDGVLQIASSDEADPLVTVDLMGTGLIPQLAISPDPTRFGKLVTICERTQTITVTNVGAASATISELAVLGTGFALRETIALPLVLEADESLDLDLTFSSDTPGDFDGQLFVRSDEPSSPRAVDLVAEVVPSVEETDEFYQGPFDSTDLMFYIDRSGSMYDDAELLAESFSLIVDALYETAFDYQVIVATSDSGCYNQAIFTPETEDAESKFLDAVFGPAGTWTEAGLTIALAALEAAGEGGCNEGWLRPGAKTNLVLVSDEPEQSAHGEEYYLERILELAPTTTITSIAGPVPSGCFSAEPGYGYDVAAEATGGELLSLCDGDWASWSGYLGETALGEETDTFVLDEEPILSTLTVTLNGEANTDWAYDRELNALVFPADRLPEPEAHIVAQYMIGSDCD